MRVLLFLLLAALAARAQEAQPPPPPPAQEQKQQLSKEDEELIKELALLERLDLVRNLDLFEQDKDDGPDEPPQRQQ